MLKKISPQLERSLRSMGWHPDRFVLATEWERRILEYGFEALSESLDIIHSFGDIVMRPTLAVAYQPPALYFDPLYPGGTGFEPDRVLPFEKILCAELNPLAEVDFGHATLVLASDHRVLMSSDHLLYEMGSTFEDALENTLVFGRRVPPVVASLR